MIHPHSHLRILSLAILDISSQVRNRKHLYSTPRLKMSTNIYEPKVRDFGITSPPFPEKSSPSPTKPPSAPKPATWTCSDCDGINNLCPINEPCSKCKQHLRCSKCDVKSEGRVMTGRRGTILSEGGKREHRRWCRVLCLVGGRKRVGVNHGL
jgi:hypothetical protein